MNLKGVYLDMDELIAKYDGKIGSVSDSSEIQQISLFCQQNRNDYRNPVLMDMINPMFAYAGLYPQAQQFHFYDPEVADNVTEEGRSLMRKIIEYVKKAGYTPLVGEDDDRLVFVKKDSNK